MKTERLLGYIDKRIFLYLFTISLFFISSCSTQRITDNNSWRLVYENDKEGNVITGDINKLIEAVNNGQEIRVMTYNDEQKYLTEAENIWVRNGIVYIQNSSHISVTFNEDKLFIQDNAYHFYFTYSTEGDRIVSRWYVGEHKSGGGDSYKTAGKWFAK